MSFQQIYVKHLKSSITAIFNLLHIILKIYHAEIVIYCVIIMKQSLFIFKFVLYLQFTKLL